MVKRELPPFESASIDNVNKDFHVDIEAADTNISNDVDKNIDVDQFIRSQIGSVVTGLSDTISTSNDVDKNVVEDGVVRSQLGYIFTGLSDTINNNLIIARYGIVGSITLLTLYGLSQTPLFFRYRTLSEIPNTYFHQRRSIYCRVVDVVRTTSNQQQQTNQQQLQQQPIQLLVRHLSPVERLLSKNTLDFVMRYYPSQSIRKTFISTSKDNNSDLFTIQLPGIVTPPKPISRVQDNVRHPPPVIFGINDESHSSGTNTTGSRRIDNIQQEWLNRWITEKHTIRCKLLAKIDSIEHDDSNMIGRNKRPIPDLTIDDNTTNKISSCYAVGIVSYWTRPYNPLTHVDLSENIVRSGNAFVSSNGMYDTTQQGSDSTDSTKVLEVVSTKVQHLKNDVSYLERLHVAEYNACKGMYGVWANESIRELRKDVTDEVNFQLSASRISKLWRWLRG